VVDSHVTQLTRRKWEELFKQQGFLVTSQVGPMSLMDPRGMIRDEGVLGALKIIRNGLKRENRPQFQAMYRLFKENSFNYITGVSTKLEENDQWNF